MMWRVVLQGWILSLQPGLQSSFIKKIFKQFLDSELKLFCKSLTSNSSSFTLNPFLYTRTKHGIQLIKIFIHFKPPAPPTEGSWLQGHGFESWTGNSSDVQLTCNMRMSLVLQTEYKDGRHVSTSSRCSQMKPKYPDTSCVMWDQSRREPRYRGPANTPDSDLVLLITCFPTQLMLARYLKQV